MAGPKKHKPEECTICGRRLSGKSAMNRHMASHLPRELRPFPCPEPGCNYRATQKSNLATHFYQHTGEKPFKCTIPGCIFRCNDRSSLGRHVRYHKRRGSKRPFHASMRSTTGQRKNTAPYNIPEGHASSSRLQTDDDAEDDENDSAAYSGGHFAPYPGPADSSGASTASQSPVAHFSQSFVAQEGHVFSFDPFAQTIGHSVLNNDGAHGVSSGYTPPSLPFPLVQQDVGDVTVSTPESLFPMSYGAVDTSTPLVQHGVHDAPFASPNPALYGMGNSRLPVTPPGINNATVHTPSLSLALYGTDNSSVHPMPAMQQDINHTTISTPASQSSFSGGMANSPSSTSLASPAVSYTTDASIHTPSPLSPAPYDMVNSPSSASSGSPVIAYTIDGMHVPTPSFTPPYEIQSDVNGSPSSATASWTPDAYATPRYGYNRYATAPASINVAQPNLFATPNSTDVGDNAYAQPQSQVIYAPAGADAFPAQGFESYHDTQTYQGYAYTNSATGTAYPAQNIQSYPNAQNMDSTTGTAYHATNAQGYQNVQDYAYICSTTGTAYLGQSGQGYDNNAQGYQEYAHMGSTTGTTYSAQNAQSSQGDTYAHSTTGTAYPAQNMQSYQNFQSYQGSAYAHLTTGTAYPAQNAQIYQVPHNYQGGSYAHSSTSFVYSAENAQGYQHFQNFQGEASMQSVIGTAYQYTDGFTSEYLGMQGPHA